MTDLAGKVALVTGGTRGIGKACAITLAEAGALVVICGRDAAKSAEAAAELAAQTSGQIHGFACDIASSASVDALFKEAAAAFGPISILVNNAGITRDGLLMRMKDDDWHAVLETNLSGFFYCCRAAARDMVKQRWGRIINLSSIIGLRGQAGQANYAAAKAGIIGFTKSLAQELASRNITVNAICPGYIETDMTAALSEKQMQAIIERIPAGRAGKPEEIASAVRFLASEQAAYITGSILQIDGGLAM